MSVSYRERVQRLKRELVFVLIAKGPYKDKGSAETAISNTDIDLLDKDIKKVYRRFFTAKYPV